MNVIFTEKLDKFVAGQLAIGNYSSSNEIIIESLHLLEKRESQLKRLQTLIQDGKNSPLRPGKEAMQSIRSTFLEKHGL